MKFERTIRALLAAASSAPAFAGEGGHPEGGGGASSAERREKRAAWVRETAAAWRKAQRQMDDRCSEAVERLDEEAFERFCDAEEAKVEEIYEQLRSVVEKDLWPRELYFGDV